MTAEEIDVKGLDYSIEGIDSDFIDQEFYTPEIEHGDLYLPNNSANILRLNTYTEQEKLTFTHRNKGRYTLHAWSDGVGLLTDPSDLVWIYDSDEDVTVYRNGDEFVAAFNPDIADVWEDLMNGEWMQDFVEDNNESTHHEGGFNRLHPEVEKRVVRGLDL